GPDGVTYFLELGGHCGHSWSPRREDGPSGLIAEFLKELAQPQPSLEALPTLAAEIDQQDRASAVVANYSSKPKPLRCAAQLKCQAPMEITWISISQSAASPRS